jgi:hypothetical protein
MSTVSSQSVQNNKPNNTQYVDPVVNVTRFMDLPHAVAVEIFSKLDTTSLGKLHLVCKRIRNLTNDPIFWRQLLIRDFGIDIADENTDKRCKEIYQNKYKEAKEFIKSLPHSNLLLISNEASSVVVYGRLLPQNFDNYIVSLTKDELSQVFTRCAGFGFTLLMKAIMHHSRFEMVPLNGMFGLSCAFAQAAGYSQISAIQLIISNSRFAKIESYNESVILAKYMIEARHVKKLADH